jgi:hypothetical protein
MKPNIWGFLGERKVELFAAVGSKKQMTVHLLGTNALQM